MPTFAVPLPDLVRLNQRVHDRIDPLFRRRGVRRLAWAALAFFLFVSSVWIWSASGLPSSEKLLSYQPPLPTNVRGYDGNPVQTFARERRVELAYDEYPPVVVNAIISAEDKTFFSHGGLDYPGVTKAVFNYTLSVGRGGRVPGGSTITQQVARQFFLSSEYSYTRKLAEMLLAMRMERELSKDEIFELYLNKSFFGNRAYGVGAAAEFYYGRKPTELSLDEMA